MDAIELVIYLTALSVLGPALIYMAVPRNIALSVSERIAAS